jgi:hypothetical protein
VVHQLPVLLIDPFVFWERIRTRPIFQLCVTWKWLFRRWWLCCPPWNYPHLLHVTFLVLFMYTSVCTFIQLITRSKCKYSTFLFYYIPPCTYLLLFSFWVLIACLISLLHGPVWWRLLSSSIPFPFLVDHSHGFIDNHDIYFKWVKQNQCRDCRKTNHCHCVTRKW